MSKHDGSLHVDGATTPLMQLLLRRRSVRRYETQPATDDQVCYVEKCAAKFQQRMDFQAPRIVILGRGEEYDAVVGGATAGLLGKINPWLPFTKASHLILCGTVYSSAGQAGTGDSSRSETERAIAQAAMTMQVAILAATEVGLGTCWMAGIHHERVERAYALPDDANLVAISTLGTAPSRMRLSWDAVAYHLVSKRRKPLEQLRMDEQWSEAT